MSTATSGAAANQKDIYIPETATVLKAETMTEMEKFFEFKLDSGRELGYMPGQFVEVSIPGIGEAPISISSSPTQKDIFQMVVRKAGNVTNHMHNLKAGDKVGIRGPYGKYFPVDTAMKGKDILFICGGIGLVPLRSAIRYVLDNRSDYGNNINILFGCKSPSERLFTDELAEWGSRRDALFMETVDSAEDGWKGNEGVITTLMKRSDQQFDTKSTVQVGMDLSKMMAPGLTVEPGNAIALICGPPVMYKFVILELKKLEIPPERIYVSLERHMKCGVGKCGHCQIGGYYVCQDGPVFKYSDVIDVQEAI